MKTKTTPVNLKPYQFHGVDLDDEGTKDATGDCPFCGKEGHFNVNVKSGLFRCLVCDESGNPATFIQKLWDVSREATPKKGLEKLARDRDLPVWVLEEWGVVLSAITGEALIPAFNTKGKLANLFRYADLSGRMAVMSTPGCKLHPFGTRRLLKEKKKLKTIHLLEGPWDGMAMDVALSQVRKAGSKFIRTASASNSMRASHGVLAVPGVNVFTVDWLDYLKGKESRSCFDNDHPRKTPNGKGTLSPGWDGQTRLVKLMEKDSRRPKAHYITRWGDGPKGSDKSRADGFDFRDLWKEKGSVGALKELHSLQELSKFKAPATAQENSGPELEPMERSSFAELLQDYHSVLHFTQPLEDTLAVMLAVVASTGLDGDQLWFRIIGPPGSGKSTLAEAVGADRDHCLNQSIVTGFHSGYVGGSKKDASLIPQMSGKTAITKDADTLLTSPNRDKILAELRDLYDRTSRATYRNRVSRVYENVNITFLLCGTDSLRKMNRSFLGERFLDCEILGEADRTPYLDRAAKNTFSKLVASMKPKEEEAEENEATAGSEGEVLLKRTTMGFIRFLKEGLSEGTLPVPTMDQKTEDTLKAMGQFLSYMRARADEDEDGLSHRPRVELGTRLVSQFIKLAFCVAIVMGKKKVDRDCVRICRKVVHDTAEGFRFDIVKLLYPMRTGGLTSKQLEVELHIPDTSVRRLLHELRMFNILQRDSKPNRSGQRGRNLHVWQLTAPIRKLYRAALAPPVKKKGSP